MAHAGLRRKVDHCPKPMLRKQPRNRSTIREIHLDETESRMLAQDPRQRQLILEGGARLAFLEYDWSLNDSR